MTTIIFNFMLNIFIKKIVTYIFIIGPDVSEIKTFSLKCLCENEKLHCNILIALLIIE